MVEIELSVAFFWGNSEVLHARYSERSKIPAPEAASYNSPWHKAWKPDFRQRKSEIGWLRVVKRVFWQQKTLNFLWNSRVLSPWDDLRNGSWRETWFMESGSIDLWTSYWKSSFRTRKLSCVKGIAKTSGTKHSER